MNADQVTIRAMGEADAAVIASAFAAIGWHKPAEQYRRYLAEQAEARRIVLVAESDGAVVGYCTVVWEPSYSALREAGVPEIQDLNDLPPFRKRGVGTKLLGQAEARVAQRSKRVGISVGLHPGYNAAQRLYVKRGYVPDGLGVTYRSRHVQEGEQVVADDELLLHFMKGIPACDAAAG